MNGWQCPKCGRVWAPHVAACTRCNSDIDNRDQQKERKLQNDYVQQMNKAEKEMVESQIREQPYPADPDPFGPGKLAPNAYGRGFSEVRRGGKAVTVLQRGPKPDPSVYQQLGFYRR